MSRKTDTDIRAAEPVDLAVSRERIDAIDGRIVELFEERMRVAADVAAYKRAKGLAVLDREREARKIESVQQAASDEFKQYMAPLFGFIMEMSRAYQHGLLEDDPASPAEPARIGALPAAPRVACQGVAGAYSHAAARALFPEGDVAFCDSWARACDEVCRGTADYAVLPLENSTAGTVNRVYDLLVQRGLFIVSSLSLRIEHALLAKEGCRIDEIREVFSHEQALRQCDGFIASLAGDVRATVCENTATAARTVADDPRRDVAAIASPACADLYGLSVLADAVQDESDNFTRFICVARTPQMTADADRSSFLLVLAHEPGSLHRVLARIAALGANLLKLESRPIPGKRFDFMFYVDVASVPSDGMFDDLVAQVSPLCESFSYLGSYREQAR